MEKIVVGGKNLQAAIANGLEKLSATKEEVEYEVLTAGGLFRQCKIEIWKNKRKETYTGSFCRRLWKKRAGKRRLKNGGRRNRFAQRSERRQRRHYRTQRRRTGESEVFDRSCRAQRRGKETGYRRLQRIPRKTRKDVGKISQKPGTKVIRTGRKTRLEPMNSYERRIIHTALKTATKSRRTVRVPNPSDTSLSKKTARKN